MPGEPQRPLRPNLLIVGIDEPSFQEFRQAWPWPRSLHAALVGPVGRRRGPVDRL